MEINTSNENKNDEITISIRIPMDLSAVLEHVQAVILKTAIEKFNGNRTHAANSLGLNRTTLIWKAKRHGVFPSGSEE